MKSFGRLSSLLWILLLAGGSLFILVYAGMAVIRISYPYHLEWMEGGSLSHVQRVLEGRPLYVRPSMEFAPITYTPLYFYVSAAVAALGSGSGFLPLRLVSFLSSLGCLGILFQLVRRETSHAWAGLLAASLFAATYRLSGCWFDLARVDSLFLLLLLASVYLVRFSASGYSAVAAGGLLTLSFLTKQTALPLAFPLLFWSVVARPRWAWRFIASFGILCGGSVLLLEKMSGGWFRFYAFTVPFDIAVIPLPIPQFLQKDVFGPLGIAATLGIVYLLALSLWGRDTRQTALFYGLMSCGAVAVTYLTRRKVGAFVNDLIPAHAFTAILFALAVAYLRERLRVPGEAARPGFPWRPALEAALAALCLAQLALLVYDPRPQLPTTADRRAGDQIVRWIRESEGEVYLPEMGYLASFAGKRAYIDAMCLLPVVSFHDRTLGKEVLGQIRGAVGESRFSALFFALPDWTSDRLLGKQLKQNYAGTRIFYPLPPGEESQASPRRGTRWVLNEKGARESDAFLPLTGLSIRPILLYTRRDA